jgi:phosphoglycolate phosphatase-like HAD superfamily hydrolase
VQIESDRFLQEFATWSRLLPGAEMLLAELRPRYRLAALSNANEICWERQTDVIGITGWFEVAMARINSECKNQIALFMKLP